MEVEGWEEEDLAVLPILNSILELLPLPCRMASQRPGSPKPYGHLAGKMRSLRNYRRL